MRSRGLAAVLLAAALGCAPTASPPECTPATCAPDACGELPDGCGGGLHCGACPQPPGDTPDDPADDPAEDAPDDPPEDAPDDVPEDEADDPAEPSGPPEVRVIGRTEQSGNGSHKFAYAGTAFEARFRGTSVRVELEDRSSSRHQNHYVFQIDGGPMGVFAGKAGVREYTLATGLSEGEHHVVFMKRTEPFVGAARFHRFLFPEGELLASPAERPRLIFVADSVTTGYGILGDGPSCPFTAREEDFTASYAYLAAKALGADAVAVAVAGAGVLRNTDGSTAETMVEFYDRASPYDPASRWSPAQDRAAAVVVALGGNDFAVGVPEREPFVARYLALLAKIRSGAPDVPVVLALSPMLTDEYPRGENHRTRARELLQAVLAEATARGDGKLSLLELDLPAEGEPYGCEWHPGPATHQRMAASLVRHLRALLGD